MELLWNGKRTGYYLCLTCEETGDRHLIKCFENDPAKFRSQNASRHFNTKMHRMDSRRKSTQIEITTDFISSIEKLYLKLLAQEKVHADIFKSPAFKEILISFANQLTGGVDPECLAKMFPSARTIKRRLKNAELEISSKFLAILKSNIRVFNLIFTDVSIQRYCGAGYGN